MNLKEIKELIEIVSADAGIAEFEVERAGVRLKIRKASGPGTETPNPGRPEAPPAALVEPVRADSIRSGPPSTDEASAHAGLYFVTAPLVGTFYRAPSPGSDPFVRVGDFVEKGSVVCIIEAMKLMNEIESEVAGEIVSIPVENGHPVEFGEKLFAIRPR